MAQATVTVDGVKVTSTCPQSTRISVHLHHKTALEQLLGAMGSLKKFLSLPQARIHSGQLSLGVTQILLGLVSCVLGVCLYFGPWTELCASGCAFWSGSVAILAGVGTVIHEKGQGKLSGHISRLLLLACFATAVAATIMGVRSLIWQTSASYHFEISSTCDSLQPRTVNPFELVRFTDNSGWKTERCREYLSMMMNLFLAFCILFTVICILKIVVSVASLGLSLWRMCGQNSQVLNDEETERKLLGGDSAPASPTKEKIPVIP